MANSQDTLHADLCELLAILGMGDHARPQSPHEVFQEALGVLRERLRLAPKPGEHWSDCAVHNEPARPAGTCDCGAQDDVEVGRILAMSDEEVIASIEAEGRDPEALAEAMRGQMGATFKLCEEIKVLREALAPFAAILAKGEPVGPIPRGLLDSKITRQDLRRATALCSTASSVPTPSPAAPFEGA